MGALLDSDESGFEFEVEMIARCIALGLPIAGSRSGRSTAASRATSGPGATSREFLRVSRDARRIVRGG